MIHLYSAICALLYTQSALQSCGGVSPQPPPVCSIHLDDATAATGQQRQYAHHTPATGGEERESLSQSSNVIFNLDLNCQSVSVSRTVLGRLFQSLGTIVLVP